MSVLECDRAGCGNIMSEYYSYKYGHLCEECFEELVRTDIKIKDFMNKEKDFEFNLDERREMLQKEFEKRR